MEYKNIRNRISSIHGNIPVPLNAYALGVLNTVAGIGSGIYSFTENKDFLPVAVILITNGVQYMSYAIRFQRIKNDLGELEAEEQERVELP
jgi:hypothetical protein